MPAVTGSGDVLSLRQLNRATLERQMLLRRRKLSAAKTIEKLVGMQAQNPLDPYYGLWNRIEGFQPDALARLILNRKAVRLGLMRSTIHLVTARDALMLRPLMQIVSDRVLRGQFGKRLAGLDMKEAVAYGRALVEEKPRGGKEVGDLLAERWPDHDPLALNVAVRMLLPLVQVPPRGVWGESGQAKHTTIEAWLGEPLPKDTSPDEVVMRYFAAFGPATVMDAQAWCGLTRLREVVDCLRPRLRVFRNEEGKELFDLPRGPRPDPDTPAPPRFLPEYDNVLLGHADRNRFVGDAPALSTTSELGYRFVLIDGTVGAIWKISREKESAMLTIETLGRLPKAHRAELEVEGSQLLAFAAPGAAKPTVKFQRR